MNQGEHYQKLDVAIVDLGAHRFSTKKPVSMRISSHTCTNKYEFQFCYGKLPIQGKTTKLRSFMCLSRIWVIKMISKMSFWERRMSSKYEMSSEQKGNLCIDKMYKGGQGLS